MIVENFTDDAFLAGATDIASTQSSEPTDGTTANASATRHIIDLAAGGNRTCNALKIWPLGSANNATFTSISVYGIQKRAGQATLADYFYWTLLFRFSATCGNVPGIAGTMIGTSYYHCDTIAALYPTANANITFKVSSPTTDSISDVKGYVVVDVEGFQKVELRYNFGTSTLGNALVAKQ